MDKDKDFQEDIIDYRQVPPGEERDFTYPQDYREVKRRRVNGLFVLLAMLMISALLAVVGFMNVGKTADYPSADAYVTGSTTSISEISEIEVNTRSSGNIKIIPGDRMKVTFSNGDSYEIEHNIEIDSENLEVKFSGSSMRLTAYTTSNMTVEIPEGYRGNFEVGTSSGKIDFNITGLSDVSLSASSGKINVGNIECDELEIAASSGKITVEGFSGRELDISASSGNIDVKCVELGSDGEIDLNTSSGKITLALPETAEFDLDARTSSGGINCDFDITASRSERKRLMGKVGGGGSEIDLSTSSGSIKITKD